MSVANPAPLSSIERPVGLRSRPDLVAQPSMFQGEACWVIKDPLAMKYYRLREPEYRVLMRLAEPVSYHELKALLNRDFPELNTRLEAVQQLVASLFQNGLLISDASGQARPLEQRHNRETRRKRWQMLSSLIAMRFPGWDPEPFLNWFYPKCRWFFTAWFTCVVVATCLSAVILIGTNFEHFRAQLPEFQQFFAFDNLLFMSGLLIVTKSIHELGHGLMCKHFGGECHQIGFMLLVMSPAMYCDTSDSWILPNRWHRMAIGAAGMYVELFLAALCTFVWWFTHPGWVHYLALNVMFLSSVSTVVFNANPLLRYDGYYILSDWLEIPNLSQKANATLISKLRVVCLGMKPLASPLVPVDGQHWLAIYCVASLVYRTMVTFSMLWFISSVLEPYGLSPLAHIVIAASLSGLVLLPLVKLTRFLMVPGRSREMNKQRMLWTCAAIVSVVLFVCCVPLPHYIWATFTVRPQSAQMLFLPQDGRLEQVLVHEGDQVQTGDTIAILTNNELAIELEELQGQLARLRSDRTAFEFISSVQVDSARKIAETVAQIHSVERQIEVKQHQLAQLTVRATRDGTLFAPPNIPTRASDDSELPSWSETPLDRQNLGAFLEANTLLGMIGQADQMEVRLIIDQADIQLVRPTQRVIALVNQDRQTFLETQINRVSQDELVEVPRELSQTNHGPIAVKPLPSGAEQPILKSYEAYAVFTPELLAAKGIQLVPGMSGHAKIRVGNSTLLNRAWRALVTVIKFR